MTDKELLEQAANAAGIKGAFFDYRPTDKFGLVLENGKTWNPLGDDGDALRLAVQLGMMLDDVTKGYMSGHIVAVSDGGTCYEPHNDDPYAATRRAIVRAAAEIGKSL